MLSMDISKDFSKFDGTIKNCDVMGQIFHLNQIRKD